MGAVVQRPLYVGERHADRVQRDEHVVDEVGRLFGRSPRVAVGAGDSQLAGLLA